MITANLTRETKIPLDKVWSLLSDFTGSPSPAFPVVVHEKGDPKNNGVGTIRTLTIGKIKVMERLEAAIPFQSFMYSILSGSPVKQYLGKWEFHEENNFTIVRWRADFKPKVPLIGWIIAMVTKRVVHQIINQIEADDMDASIT
ncbi:MAG: SRPBCC family protein [Desulfobacterales bacterium]|nr:SRPBCC family protein [Desulfobacterales bacterium]MDX2511437.1 SRPBCC family protein [Desulfobacterales bacterium]